METNNHHGERGGKRAVFCQKSWIFGLWRNCITLCSIYRICFWKIKHRQRYVRRSLYKFAWCRALSLAFNPFIREQANLAITLSGKENQVLAFSAYYDYPLVEGVDPALWEQWLHCDYALPQANVRWCKNCVKQYCCLKICKSIPHSVSIQPLNSLFLRLFVAKQGFAQGALAELIR